MHPSLFAAPSFTVRKRSASNTTGRAFVVEALVLVAFLTAAIAIVLQVFASAGVISRDAHTLSMSEHLAVNAAERFGTNLDEEAGLRHSTSNGEVLPSGSTATFSVDTVVTQEPTDAGTLYHADITVT
ncbi:MAG: hypothetical protein IJ131_07340, partial [Eggerthellaceae bacterium]|nr:hypothetical protein [Eggerthellaceae bacterium]